MNICVTGGAGYIGSVLTERLLSLGHKVTVVDTFLHGYHGIMRLAGHPLLTVVERDIRHENRDYLNKQDVVFHLAAISNIKGCEENKALAWDVNRTATAEIAKGLHCDAILIFASSTAIFGDRGGDVVISPWPLKSTHGIYSQTKLDAEGLIDKRNNTIIVRIGTVFGVSPLMRPNSIVNDFVRMAVHDKKIVLWDSLTARPYISIDGCVNYLIAAIENKKKKELLTILEGQCLKRDIVNTIRKQVEFELILSSSRDKHIQDFRFNISAHYEDIFARELHDGIRDLIKLYSFYKP